MKSKFDSVAGSTKSAKPATGKLFAERGFDPVTIIMQIVAMQLLYYAGLALCVCLCDLVGNLRPDLAQLFSPDAFDRSAPMYGYSTLFANILNIPIVVFGEAVIVEKAAKCLDFTLTIFILHYGIMWAFFEFPGLGFNYLLIQTCLITVTCLASEFLCMKLETQEIQLTVDDLLAKGKKSAAQIIQKVVQKDGEARKKVKKNRAVDNKRQVKKTLKKDEAV